MSRPIFISHAVKDRALAEAFVDLLVIAAGIKPDEIFCSSLDGYGIPSGANFVEYIRQQIQKPKIVIALLSPNYLASHFCLCELGAAWSMSHRLFPLLVPPLKHVDVKGVLLGMQVIRIDKPAELSQLAEELDQEYETADINIPRWDAKKEKFLSELPSILERAGVPIVVLPEAHEQLKKRLAQAEEALRLGTAETESLQQLVDKLKATKDRQAVQEVLRQHSGADEALHDFLTAAKDQLGGVSKAVSLACFREISGSSPVYIDRAKDPDTHESADRAADDQHLTTNDGVGYTLNRRHPKIRKLLEALEAFQHFIEHDAPEEIAEHFEDKHGFPLSISNRELWETLLDRRLKQVSS